MVVVGSIPFIVISVAMEKKIYFGTAWNVVDSKGGKVNIVRCAGLMSGLAVNST